MIRHSERRETMNEQTENLERVKRNIGQTVMEFCVELEKSGAAFTANELVEHVKRYHPSVVAESAMRVMRDLRNRGFVNYECVKRAESRYTIIGIKGA
jgi:hypothetical protein